MLTEILSKVGETEDFTKAIECLSNNFYTDGCEIDEVYNPSALDDFTDDYPASWSNGISKVVLIFADFVLKTSFTGWAERNWGENVESWTSDYFYNEETDYCELEYKVYQAAAQAHLEKFFAEIIYVSNGIYMQEAFDECFQDWKPEDSIKPEIPDEDFKTFNILRKKAEMAFPYLYAQYSREELLRLQNFLEEFDINDLHSGNLGWFNGVLKFVDYSGYGSETSNLL